MTREFDVLADEKHLYVLYGLGDASYLARLVEQPLVRHALVFEPSPACVSEAKTKHPKLFANPKVRVISGTDKNAYGAAITAYFEEDATRYYYAGFFGNLVTPGTEKRPGIQANLLEFAEAFKNALDNYTAQIRSRPPEDNFRGFMNSVGNLKNYPDYPNIAALAGTLKDVPAIVIGSGPSLVKSLPHLKLIQNDAILFACDSTLKVLINAGIKPHFTAALERVPWVADLFADIAPKDAPPLIAPSIVPPALFKNYPGQKLAICRCIGFDAWLYPEESRYFLGSSVSHLCMAAATILGSRDIWLVGCDSAYAPGSNGDAAGIYTDGATSRMDEIARDIVPSIISDKQIFDVPGYDGTQRKTQLYWYQFAHIYQQVANECGLTNFKNVMPANYGIPIPGSTRVEPETLASLKKNGAISSQITNLLQSATPRPSHHANILTRTRAALSRIETVCLEESLRISEFAFANMPLVPKNREKYPEFFHSIEKRRHALMTGENGLFERLIVPLFLNEHALMEHDLRRAAAAGGARKLDVQSKLYQDWFHGVLVWCRRIQGYLTRHGL